MRGHPVSGQYYSVSLWKDQQSLLAFAHHRAHTQAVAGMAELGPARGVLASRDANPRQRPTWRDTRRWLATLDPVGRYQHHPGPAPEDVSAETP